jgi:hypothetical protein
MEKSFERFEVFTAVTMKNAVFWDVAPCRSCVNRRFGGTYLLHLQSAVCSHLLSLILRSRIFLPWKWRRYVLPKRLFTQDRHGATSQKMVFFKPFEIWRGIIYFTLNLVALCPFFCPLIPLCHYLLSSLNNELISVSFRWHSFRHGAATCESTRMWKLRARVRAHTQIYFV